MTKSIFSLAGRNMHAEHPAGERHKWETWARYQSLLRRSGNWFRPPTKAEWVQLDRQISAVLSHCRLNTFEFALFIQAFHNVEKHLGVTHNKYDYEVWPGVSPEAALALQQQADEGAVENP